MTSQAFSVEAADGRGKRACNRSQALRPAILHAVFLAAYFFRTCALILLSSAGPKMPE